MDTTDYKDMLLESASGFMMPFALDEKEELNVILPFGEQTHPKTGEKFQHQGVDYAVKDRPLYAIASGMVIGAGHDAVHENYIIARYGKYEVTYGHISEAYTPYGTNVKAGQEIAHAGEFLHMGVRFNGKELDPDNFIAMIWANIQQLAAMGITHQPTAEVLGDKKIVTKYDDCQDEIMALMLRWLPTYMNELRTKAYTPSKKMEASLKNILSKAADKNYFYETIPNLGNPLGLSGRSAPLVEKIQEILIEDFLGFLAVRQGIYPQSWDESQKKKLSEEAAANGLMEDPLQNLEIDIHSYDISREASIYFDTTGTRCWTKAWFNGREKGEKSIEITRQLAVKFINDEILLDDWLARFYPKQMNVCHKAIEQARKQLLGI